MKKLICVVLLATTANAGGLHKFVYVAEAVAAVASLGFDGYSTERGIGVPGVRESNVLFLNGSGQFSQPRFWTLKAAMAAFPIVMTYIGHKKRGNNETADIISITSSTALAAVYTWSGVHNINLVNQVAARQQ